MVSGTTVRKAWHVQGSTTRQVHKGEHMKMHTQKLHPNTKYVWECATGSPQEGERRTEGGDRLAGAEGAAGD